MKTIIVTPHKGIGNIFFGMTRKEVEEIIGSKDYKGETKANDVSVGYEQYHITYKEDKVFEICINNIGGSKVIFNGIDLFNTIAEEIFDALKLLSDYDYDCEDEYLSNTYYFKDFNMLLWREDAFHPKLLNKEPFQKFIAINEENLEYMKRYWYFDQICLKDPRDSFEPMVKIKNHYDMDFKEEIQYAVEEITEEKRREIMAKYNL